MIRVILRRIIIPRGDTGTFTIPTLTSVQEGDVAVFSVYDKLTHTTVLEKIIDATEGTIIVLFEYKDTVDIPAGKYLWDMKIYNGPKYDEDGILVGGKSINSYYSGFSLPVFEVREVTENVSRTQTNS